MFKTQNFNMRKYDFDVLRENFGVGVVPLLSEDCLVMTHVSLIILSSRM